MVLLSNPNALKVSLVRTSCQGWISFEIELAPRNLRKPGRIEFPLESAPTR